MIRVNPLIRLAIHKKQGFETGVITVTRLPKIKYTNWRLPLPFGWDRYCLLEPDVMVTPLPASTRRNVMPVVRNRLANAILLLLIYLKAPCVNRLTILIAKIF
ncbi:hypothetical protein D3C85_1377340 [compost metagenome]